MILAALLAVAVFSQPPPALVGLEVFAPPAPDSTLLPADEWVWDAGMDGCAYAQASWAFCHASFDECILEWTQDLGGGESQTWIMIRYDCDGKLMARLVDIDGELYWECPGFDDFFPDALPL